VILGAYRELFAAVAESAATLAGLLFVAMSVTPGRGPDAAPAVIQQVRAAAALLAFINALAVSIFGLVPGNNVGYPAVVLGVVGVLFTAAGMRSLREGPLTTRQRQRQWGLIVVLLLIFGTELAAGSALIADSRHTVFVQSIGNALAASLLVGIARAWELIGDRRTGIVASIAVLAGHSPGPSPTTGVPADETPGPAEAPSAEPARSPDR
jgi:hypothetical protein